MELQRKKNLALPVVLPNSTGFAFNYMSFTPLNTYYKQKTEEFHRKSEGRKVDFEVRDFRNGQWFWIHKKVLENYAEKVGAYGIAVYNALCYFANDKSQKAFPSYPTLAKMAGCSIITVKRTIKVLEKSSLIKAERKQGKVNIYKLVKVK